MTSSISPRSKRTGSISTSAVRATPAGRGCGRALGPTGPRQRHRDRRLRRRRRRRGASSATPPACARCCSTSPATRSSSPRPAASRSMVEPAPTAPLTLRIRDTGIGIAPGDSGTHLRGVRAGRRRRRPPVRRHRTGACDFQTHVARWAARSASTARPAAGATFSLHDRVAAGRDRGCRYAPRHLARSRRADRSAGSESRVRCWRGSSCRWGARPPVAVGASAAGRCCRDGRGTP